MANINNVNTESTTETVSTETVAEATPTTETVVESKPAESNNVEVKETESSNDSKPNKPTSNRNVTKADLQKKIEKLQSELSSVVDNSADFSEQISAKDSEITKLNSEVEGYKAEIEKLNTALASVIEDKKNKLPENMKNLVPENQDAISTLNWLLKAEGNITPEQAPIPEVQIGRVVPVSNTQVNTDNSDMSPYDRMTSAFAQLFSKAKK